MRDKSRDLWATQGRFLADWFALVAALLLAAIVAIGVVVFGPSPGWSTVVVAVSTNIVASLLIYVSGRVLLYRQLEHFSNELTIQRLENAVTQKIGEITIAWTKNRVAIVSPWLHSGDDILGVERSYPKDQIWVVSYTLADDWDDDLDPGERKTRDTVIENLKAGRTYIYVVPRTREIQHRIDSLKRMYDQYGKVTWRVLNPATIEQLTPLELVVYDPLGARPRIFLQLPVKATSTPWVEIEDRNTASRILRRVRQVVSA